MELTGGRVLRRGTRVYPNNDRYEGLFSEGKRDGHGVMQYASGASYRGEWRANLFDGRGHYESLDYTYHGSYLQGLKHGHGKLVGTQVYEGEFRNDKMHGSGRLDDDRGAYEGEFAAGLFHGRGRFETPEGVYDGTFERGVFHGEGRFLFAKGGSYEGEYHKGQKHGTGQRVFVNGTAYSGTYKHDKLDFGTMRYANGDQYVGSWRDDAPHGRGVSCKNGERYEGQFHNGMYHGHGKYTFREGTYEGEYVLGKRHGQGSRVFGSGNSFRGVYEHDKMSKGTLVANSTYEGEFLDDRKHGRGNEQWGNLRGESYRCGLGFKHQGRGYCRYSGNYQDDAFHGLGDFTCLDGRAYSGEWRRGKRHGKGCQVMCPAGDRGKDGCNALYRALEYQGEWHDDDRHGIGTLKMIDGTAYSGPFRRGHAHGRVLVRFKDGATRLGVFDFSRLVHWVSDDYRKPAVLRLVDALARPSDDDAATVETLPPSSRYRARRHEDVSTASVPRFSASLATFSSCTEDGAPPSPLKVL